MLTCSTHPYFCYGTREITSELLVRQICFPSITAEPKNSLSVQGIWVIGVNFSEILIKAKEILILFELAGYLSDPSMCYQGSTVLLQTTENELWKTVRLTSFQNAQCNPLQSHSSLWSSHWSIQGWSFLYLLCYLYLLLMFWAWGYFHNVSLSLVAILTKYFCDTSG